jgi:Ca-activated chloride channel family protein
MVHASTCARFLSCLLFCAAVVTVTSTIGCSNKPAPKKDAAAHRFEAARQPWADHKKDGGPATEEYERRTDNPFHLAVNEPLSTFSIDVDTASYSNVRRVLNEGSLPPKDAVRVEEFVNYFTYNYPKPDGEHPIAIAAEAATCPWNPRHQLVRVGIQGKTIGKDQMPPRNLVFLLDTSGSMDSLNRLPLLKQSLTMLTKQLTARDRVSIVAYAGSAGLILPPTRGDNHAAIVASLNWLHAGGSTNGGHGIQLAYHVAEQTFVQGGANRVIIGTDGDFNVGVTGADLIQLIETKRKTGVFLTVLGFGMGNLKDATMEKLAQHGNGTYHYIDTLAEGRRVFVEQIATLAPIAKDVKVQVEFNPAHVQAYRLVGYENRLLAHKDFNDDTKDAGDMGAGHTVTALYEIVPPGVEWSAGVDPLKFQKKIELTPAANTNEMMAVKVRYIPVDGVQSKLLTAAVTQGRRPFDEASSDFRFAASVASFGMLLRDSPHKGETSFGQIQRWAQNAQGADASGHRREFVGLVQTAQRLALR